MQTIVRKCFLQHRMLTHLRISNFTTVASCDLELVGGLSVITGETGAGKSVMLDALAMALGDRSSTSILRDEKRNAEINASFQIEKNSKIYQWLKEKGNFVHKSYFLLSSTIVFYFLLIKNYFVFRN